MSFDFDQAFNEEWEYAQAWQEASTRNDSSLTAERALIPVCDWIEANAIDPTTVNLHSWDFAKAKTLKLESFQRRILTHVLTPDKEGRFPYRTIVWSQIKKSGKTQTAGAVGAWFADQVEAPNLVLTVANDQEQSAGRIFGAMGPTIQKLGTDFPTAKNAQPVVRLQNGTVVQAIANNYAGAAGANYGLTLWSELWAFASERGHRLFDELMPVPTRKNSMRWIETYSGFEDESDLLLGIYLKVFKDTTETALQPGARRVPGLEDLPCFEVPDEGLFLFWDHERRMQWQQGEDGDRYYREMSKTLRHSAYVRLCENRWQKSEGTFIPEEWWLRSLTMPGPVRRKMVFAVDASQRNDTTSLVGVYKEGTRYKTGYVRVWEPQGKDIDLEDTVAAEIEHLHKQGLVDGAVWYDPFQMHQVAMNLRKKNILCEEFNQGNERTLADTFLYQQYKDGNIDNFADPQLAAHVQAAKAKEVEGEKLRLIKGTLSGSLKIDAAVAQSMAIYRASTPAVEPPTFKRKTFRI